MTNGVYMDGTPKVFCRRFETKPHGRLQEKTIVKIADLCCLMGLQYVYSLI